MEVSIDRMLAEAMLDFALERHPREIVLLLRGKAERGSIRIVDFLIPPLAVTGDGFAEFQPHRLPIDFSIVGTAHSHPSGVLAQSTEDLHNFYGRVMVILAHPYTPRLIAAFNARGERIPLHVLR